MCVPKKCKKKEKIWLNSLYKLPFILLKMPQFIRVTAWYSLGTRGLVGRGGVGGGVGSMVCCNSYSND